MLLWPLEVSAKKDKEIFRPLDDTFPALARVDSLIQHWMSSNPLNQGAELVLEKKSINGDGYGVGAVWGVWVTSTYRTKHGTGITKTKNLFEVKSIIPNQKIVLETTVDPSTRNSNCCAPDIPNRPTTIEFIATEKGKNTEVSAEIHATIPCFCETLPRFLLFLPCFWPHWIIIGVGMVVCTPFCRTCAKSTSEQALLNQCDQGLTALKVICEKGPEDQVMKDGPGFVAVPPPSYAGPPPSYGAIGDNAFCPKCGHSFANSSDPFCGKCGARR